MAVIAIALLSEACKVWGVAAASAAAIKETLQHKERKKKMKKLMFVAALALSATCFAESIDSNVVGYQTYQLNGGFNLVCHTFIGINGDINLQDMKVINSDGTDSDVSGVYIQPLDKDGNTGSVYTWRTRNGVYGWYKSRTEIASGISIKEGEGYYIYAPISAEGIYPKLLFSGTVKKDPSIMNLTIGFNLIGNSTATDIDLQTMRVINPDGTDSDVSGVYIQPLDKDGNTGSVYTWRTRNGVYGWYKSRTEIASDVTVKAGDGLYVYSTSSEVSVKILSAIQ